MKTLFSLAIIFIATMVIGLFVFALALALIDFVKSYPYFLDFYVVALFLGPVGLWLLIVTIGTILDNYGNY
jgi:hypothetical protein